MQLQVSLWLKILVSVGIMAVLVLLVFFFDIPNPNMILIAGLVLCSALFGYWGGGIAAAVMLVYTLYFFSTDHGFTRFTPQNVQKVIVSVVGIVADMLFVCALKQAEVKDFNKVKNLTEQLRAENDKLQQMSCTDALTGVRNRMALRQDYDLYKGHEVTVMMLDVDHFKRINDASGHEVGDSVLAESGALLSEHFGREHCYRFGGDEFLVICPDKSLAEFEETLAAFMSKRPLVDVQGECLAVGYSVGYAHEVVGEEHPLRTLFSIADERMYEAKRARAAD